MSAMHWDGRWSQVKLTSKQFYRYSRPYHYKKTVFAHSLLLLQGIQSESSTAAQQPCGHATLKAVLTTRPSCNMWDTLDIVAWGKARLDSSGLVNRRRATFHPDPSNVVVVVLADVTTRRQPHSVALFCAQGHGGVRGYEWWETWSVTHW